MDSRKLSIENSVDNLVVAAIGRSGHWINSHQSKMAEAVFRSQRNKAGITFNCFTCRVVAIKLVHLFESFSARVVVCC